MSIRDPLLLKEPEIVSDLGSNLFKSLVLKVLTITFFFLDSWRVVEIGDWLTAYLF